MTKNILVATFLAIGILPSAARASLITGELNFTGSVSISLDSVAFGPVSGPFTIGPADMQQGGFMALAGTTGSIKNITNPPYATGVIFPTPDFMTFAAAPNISITMLELLPGTDGAAGCADTPAASGQTCTPTGSDENQFNLQNTSATSSTASFAIFGDEVDSLTNTSSFITGTFTIPFTTENFQELLATLNGGGTITTPFSGELDITPAVAATPEPATLIDFLIGGISGLGLYVRRTSLRTKNCYRAFGSY
jgi:hypothetical protein